jgi:GNAT superfamily N-acetyltransferase
MSDVEIRPRGRGDIPELAKVLVRVHAEDGYPVEGVTDPSGWLTPPRELAAWTAMLNGRPIGHMSLTQAGDTDDAAVIWQHATGQDISRLAIPVRLFVDPQHRQRGAGKLLMLAAHTFASQHGLAMAFDVMLKDREAIRLYEAVGCQRLGEITHQHGDGQTEPAAVYVAPRKPLTP